MFEKLHDDNVESKNLNFDEKVSFSANESKDIHDSKEVSSKFVRNPEEVKKIEKNSPFSNEINDYIRTKEELDIYKNAPLKEGKVNGKATLERTDIDYNQFNESKGKTNLELMKEGKAPYDKDGRKIHLHHIGQENSSPLAELTEREHTSKPNTNILHDGREETEIDRGEFNKTEKKEYWKARAKQIEDQINKN